MTLISYELHALLLLAPLAACSLGQQMEFFTCCAAAYAQYGSGRYCCQCAAQRLAEPL